MQVTEDVMLRQGAKVVEQPSLTTQQRASIRRSLLDKGYHRTLFTRDHGDGKYMELWTDGNEHAIISWAPKDRSGDGQV